MDQRQRTKRFGVYVILCACLIRLISGGFPAVILAWTAELNTIPFHTYLETGRNVRFSASSEGFSVRLRESPMPQLPQQPLPRFSGEDAQEADVYYSCALRPELAELMEKPLAWDLTGDQPSVLILHTHTTESYTQAGEGYRETSKYRTLEEDYNMLSIGDAVAEILTAAGICVVHDREIHDYPSYNGSYVHARASMESLLAQHSSIQLVLDLHRDASEAGGEQLRTEALVDGQPSAQLMLVVGTDVSRQSHENWQENLALALKLHVQLERRCPGIMRPLNLRPQRFNQDLSPGALLVEVGAAGNTHEEALNAARQLAEAIIDLARGTERKSS